MKNVITLFALSVVILFGQNIYAQVSVNTDGSDPDASAMFDVKSTTSGVLVPRMTAAERDLIGTPATGLMVFVTDDNSFYFYNGSTWNQIGGDDGDWTTSGSDIYSSNAGNVGIGTSTPDEKLHVAGSAKIVDGTEGAGKVLVSDVDGVSSWTDANDGLPLPDTTLPIPIQYHGSYIYVHPTENWPTNTTWLNAYWVCENLNAFGYSDWFVPSISELNAMYKQSYLLTGLFENASYKYWSSTEVDANNAYSQRWDYGGPDPDLKSDLTNHKVRCIRKN